MVTETITVNGCMTGPDRRLSLIALFELTQQLCCNGVAALGIGVEELVPRGLTWVVLRQRAEILRLPFSGETVTLFTYPGKAEHGLYYRHVLARDSAGQLLFRYISLWSVLDLQTRTIAPSGRTGIAPAPEQTPGELTGVPPIRFTAPQFAENRMVRFSDTDFNGHLNNVRYLAFFLDALGGSALAGKSALSCSLNYAREVREGEALALETEQQGSCFRCRGTAAGKTVFSAELLTQPEKTP